MNANDFVLPEKIMEHIGVNPGDRVRVYYLPEGRVMLSSDAPAAPKTLPPRRATR